jgi:2'-hydroxyisoflavone reductase
VPEAGEFAGFLEIDTSEAARTGLVCRPVKDTVTDTWQWLEREGMPAQRPDRDVHGLPAALEQQVLASQ